MTLLLIILLVVLLVLSVASLCFWVNHGGFIGFYMAGQAWEVVGLLLQALVHVVGACLSGSSSD
jgi:hypothetical protein